jgi:peptide methionine sulfoxide reductase MsrA
MQKQQVESDPNEVSYEHLLDVFWSIHNPTNKNRQGWDIGSQYRSLIAYHTFGVIYLKWLQNIVLLIR